MPLYTYTCAKHGEFKAWGKMSDSEAPQPCPSCAGSSPRALAKPMVAKGESGGEVGECGMDGCGMDGCGMGACDAGAGMGAGHVCGAGCMH